MFVESFLFEKPSEAHISEGVLDYLLKVHILRLKISFKMRVEFKLKHN